MISRRRKLAVAVSGGVLIVSMVSIAAVLSGESADPRRVATITPTDAIRAVRTFTQETEDLTVGDAVDGALGRTYQVAGQRVSALVDVADGRVVLCQWPARIPELAAGAVVPLVGAADAEARAAEFLKSHQVDSVELGAPTVRFIDHGSVAEFEVTWQQTSDDGVLLPNSRIVRVNALTGEVFSFLDLRRPYSAPGSPRVSAEAAKGAARAASGLADVTSAKLRVVFDARGLQGLVWRVELARATNAGVDAAAIVEVDSETGIAVVVGGAP